MDLLNKVASAAEGVTGVKVDEGEDMKQTMKEKAMEEVMEDKLRKVAGDKVAENSMAQTAIEKVADMTSQKVPDSWVASGAGAMAAEESEKQGGPGMGQLAGMAGMASSVMGGGGSTDEKPAEGGGMAGLANMAGGLLGGDQK